MAIDFSVNTPQPQESYERSRPQTPSLTTKTETTPSTMPPPVTSPHNQNGHRPPHDAFMGGTASRPHTRPATPFNPSFSVPATPPDLYLVTRNSPNLSQNIWENFQPDQLFPESTNMPLFPHLSPTQQQSSLDPNMVHMPSGLPNQPIEYTQGVKRNLAGSPLPNNPNNNNNDNGLLHPGGMPGQGQGQQGGYGNNQSNSFWNANFDGQIGGGGANDGHSPSDSWSNSSVHGQSVPSTLNVEDW